MENGKWKMENGKWKMEKLTINDLVVVALLHIAFVVTVRQIAPNATQITDLVSCNNHGIKLIVRILHKLAIRLA